MQISRRNLVKQFAFGSALLGTGWLDRIAHAAAAIPDADAAPDIRLGAGVSLRQLMVQPLEGAMSGHVAALVVVEYAPGASTSAHRYAGTALSHVLQGRISVALNCAAPIVYSAGACWWEDAQASRAVSNPSLTEPARTLTFIIGATGRVLIEPAGTMA